MASVLGWVKAHKLSTFLLILVFLLLFGRFLTIFILGVSNNMLGGDSFDVGYGESKQNAYMMDSPLSAGMGSSGITREADMLLSPSPSLPPSSDRKVITNSNFSILVKSVSDTIENIKMKTTQLGGFVINSSINRGEQYEYATLEIRVPSERVEDISKYLRSQAIKVVSENISGTDITDKYTDYQARLDELYTNKTRFQQIMTQATTVDEILRVQSRIFEVQNQIDSYLGQLKYMENASSTSRLVITLSTDELSLPYAPKNPWRPEVVFKNAVRSMLGTLQNFGSLIIWFVTYIPVFIVLYICWKLLKFTWKRFRLPKNQ